MKDHSDMEKHLSAIKECKARLHNGLQQYYFQNDHIVRGPLCRALGLVNLLQIENLSEDAVRLIGMITNELKEIEQITLVISKSLNDLEERIHKDFDCTNSN